MTQPTAPDPTHQPTGQEIFDKLDDFGKRDFVLDDYDGVIAGLNALITKLSDLKVGAEDPDQVVRVTLAYNGRLTRLWMDPSATDRFTNLELEDKLNKTIRDAQAGVDELWAAEREHAIDYLPPA